ncbi:MAG: imelysin family protein [Deltaproteobacteria bacterium]|nr:imelysin family protein [Deltaproteobacteria bacterium]
MKRKKLLLLFSLISLWLNPPACGGSAGGGSETSLDLSLLFTSFGQTLILPTYESLHTQTEMLSQNLNLLCENLNEENLIQAQNSWIEVHDLLMRSESFAIGPYHSLGLENTINFWPARPTDIENFLVTQESFSADSLVSLGVLARGLKPMEYLLFKEAEGTSNVLEGLNLSPKRCQFLNAMGEDLANQTSTLLNAWIPEGGNFSAELSLAGSDSQAYPNLNDALSSIINVISQSLETWKDKKILKPQGIMSAEGIAQPDLVENPFAHHSRESLQQNLLGLSLIYGTESNTDLRLYDLLAEKNLGLAQEGLVLIQNALISVESMTLPLSQSLTEDPESVEALSQSILELRDFFSGSVASVLGVTITFNDTDGD